MLLLIYSLYPSPTSIFPIEFIVLGIKNAPLSFFTIVKSDNIELNATSTGIGFVGKYDIKFQPGDNDIGVLKSICDPSGAIRDTMADQYPDVSLTEDYSEILNDSTVDGVFIAAPAVKHFELAKLALEADKHVFIEKPLALDLKDGQALVDMAEEKSKVLFVGHILHYHPASIKIKEILSKGTIGRLQYIYSNRLNLDTVMENLYLVLAIKHGNLWFKRNRRFLNGYYRFEVYVFRELVQFGLNRNRRTI